MVIDVFERDELPFPYSLPEFQRLFPNEVACAAYLEHARWRDGFVCRQCGATDEPYRFTNRPGVLRCRHCDRDTSLTASTVMERAHAALGMVLGCLLGHQSDAGHVGHPVSTATRIVAL